MNPTDIRNIFGLLTSNIGAEIQLGLTYILSLVAGLLSIAVLVKYTLKYLRSDGPGPHIMTSANHQSKRFKRIMSKL